MMMLVLSRCGIATAIGSGAMARRCGGHEHTQDKDSSKAGYQRVCNNSFHYSRQTPFK